MENYSIQHTVLKSTVGEFSARPVVKTGALTSAEGPGLVPGGELRSHISTDKPRGTAKKKKIKKNKILLLNSAQNTLAIEKNTCF